MEMTPGLVPPASHSRARSTTGPEQLRRALMLQVICWVSVHTCPALQSQRASAPRRSPPWPCTLLDVIICVEGTSNLNGSWC